MPTRLKLTGSRLLEAQPTLIGHLVAEKLLSSGSPEHDGTSIVDFYKNGFKIFK